VPGSWSEADIQFQAEHITTQKFHNVGFNCVASQVLVLPASWGRKDQLLDALRATIRSIPPRNAYYPAHSIGKRRWSGPTLRPSFSTRWARELSPEPWSPD
jgi:hypothetical protein